MTTTVAVAVYVGTTTDEPHVSPRCRTCGSVEGWVAGWLLSPPCSRVATWNWVREKGLFFPQDRTARTSKVVELSSDQVNRRWRLPLAPNKNLIKDGSSEMLHRHSGLRRTSTNVAAIAHQPTAPPPRPLAHTPTHTHAPHTHARTRTLTPCRRHRYARRWFHALIQPRAVSQQ